MSGYSILCNTSIHCKTVIKCVFRFWGSSMVAAHAIYFPLLSAFSAVFIFAGRLTVSNELKQTETDAVCIRGRMIWTILAAAGTAGTAVSFLIFRQIPPFRLFFLYYVFLYSSLIGIVDFYSHNYYLEMLPWLLPFILLGCITWGVTDALFGLLAGGCIGTVLALTEWLFFRKLFLPVSPNWIKFLIFKIIYSYLKICILNLIKVCETMKK